MSTCKTCDYWKDEICISARSPYYEDFTSGEDTCEYWVEFTVKHKNKVKAEIQKARATLNRIERMVDKWEMK